MAFGKRGQNEYGNILLRAFRKEFRCKSFTFQYVKPADFSQPQWKWMEGKFFILYRFVIATFLVTWLACEIPYEIRNRRNNHPFIWFTFATNWAFTLYTISCLIFAVLSLHSALEPGNSEKWNKILWFAHGQSSNILLVTSIIYWVAFWDREFVEFYHLSAKLKHSIPAMLVIADSCINIIPIRLFHVIYSIVCGLIYAVFTYIYWMVGLPGYTGVGIIYPALNWNNATMATIACVLAVLLCIVVQVLLYLIYIGRAALSFRVGGHGCKQLEDSLEENNEFVGLIHNEDAELLEDYSEVSNSQKNYDSVE